MGCTVHKEWLSTPLCLTFGIQRVLAIRGSWKSPLHTAALNMQTCCFLFACCSNWTIENQPLIKCLEVLQTSTSSLEFWAWNYALGRRYWKSGVGLVLWVACCRCIVCSLKSAELSMAALSVTVCCYRLVQYQSSGFWSISHIDYF